MNSSAGIQITLFVVATRCGGWDPRSGERSYNPSANINLDISKHDISKLIDSGNSQVSPL